MVSGSVVERERPPAAVAPAVGRRRVTDAARTLTESRVIGRWSRRHSVLPFMLVMLALIGLLAAYPAIATWLPAKMRG